MPAANFFSSAASFCSASSREAVADSTRFWLASTCRATLRTCETTCISMLRSCVCDCAYCSFARSRLAFDVLVPSG